MSGNHSFQFPRRAPAAGPSPEGSPAFFGGLPRRRPQGWWCSRGLFDDFIDGLDYDEYLRGIMDIYADDSSEDCVDEFEELVEYYNNQRW
jgi:hypothetical protein